MTDRIINHDVRVVNGKTLYLPPFIDNQEGWANLKLPDLSLADTVQQYPIGTRFVDGDNAYRYAKAVGTTRQDLLCSFQSKQAVGYCTIAANALQYASRVVIDVAATDGVSGDGAIVADELAGGYILIFDATSSGGAPQVLLVKSNTVTTGAGEMTIDFDGKLQNALVADTDHAEVIASPYSRVSNVSAKNNEYAKVGRPTVIATSGQWLWLQTWGVCFLSPQTDVGVNSGGSGAGNNYAIVARHDGSLDTLLYSDVTHDQGQIVGSVLACGADGAQGAPFVYLRIAH